MSGSYRDETESLRAKAAHLEEELASREAEVEELRRRLADQEAVFTRLEGVIGQKEKGRSGRWFFVGGLLLASAGVASAVFGLRTARSSELPVVATAQAPVSVPTPPAAAPLGGDLCARLGVRLTVGGEDAEAPAQGPRDLAGHKYRRDGSRSPWFTVNGGPLYVHAVGGYLPGDVGTTQLSLFTVMTKGETDGYRLARDGKSLLEVQGSDGKHIWGRFEADASKVPDTTREAPFGTPVVRMRGTFCLPALPADPSDTGP